MFWHSPPDVAATTMSTMISMKRTTGRRAMASSSRLSSVETLINHGSYCTLLWIVSILSRNADLLLAKVSETIHRTTWRRFLSNLLMSVPTFYLQKPGKTVTKETTLLMLTYPVISLSLFGSEMYCARITIRITNTAHVHSVMLFWEIPFSKTNMVDYIIFLPDL